MARRSRRAAGFKFKKKDRGQDAAATKAKAVSQTKSQRANSPTKEKPSTRGRKRPKSDVAGSTPSAEHVKRPRTRAKPKPGVERATIRMPSVKYTGDAALQRLVRNVVQAEVDFAVKKVATVFDGKLENYFVSLVGKKVPAARVVRQPNPRNEHLRQREKDLLATLERLSAEQDAWSDALKRHTAAADTLPEVKNDDNSGVPGEKMAKELPQLARNALEEYDVGLMVVDASARVAAAILNEGQQATAQLSAAFYSESFRNVPNHEQPFLAVRALSRATASGAVTATALVDQDGHIAHDKTGASSSSSSSSSKPSEESKASSKANSSGTSKAGGVAPASPPPSTHTPRSSPRSASRSARRRSVGSSRRKSVR